VLLSWHWVLPSPELLAAGAPHEDLYKGITDEHCAKAGCTDDFETSNYGVRTNPLKEFEIATGQRQCPAEDMLDRKGRKVRVVKRIEELKLLKTAHKAGLTDDEILAVVRPPPAYSNMPRSYPYVSSFESANMPPS
jgi:hypothetical protein